jgi:hypothetical protein
MSYFRCGVVIYRTAESGFGRMVRMRRYKRMSIDFGSLMRSLMGY